MAFTPISNDFIQYQATASGTSAAAYFLKLYEAGTTTPISAALDSAGSVLVAKVELDSLGFAVNGSGGSTTVYIDQTYRLVLYVNATDADNNTFANAVQDTDNIPQTLTQEAINESLNAVKNIATLALAVSDINLVDGDAISIAERTTGNGGGAIWDVVLSSTVTEDTYGIVQCTGVATLSLVLRIGDKISIRQYGATGDGVTDDTGAFDSAIDLYNKTIVIEDGNYLVNNIDIKSETTIEGTLLAFMFCSTAGGAIFLADTGVSGDAFSDVTNIRLKGFSAGVNGSLAGCAFIRQTNMTSYLSYCQFEDIETFLDFETSYQIYPIYTSWVNGRDGFQGNVKNPTHQALSCIPTITSQTKTTNANSMTNFKAFNSSHADGAFSIQLGFRWSFIDCAWEKNTTRALHMLGIISVHLKGCYFEGNTADDQIFASATAGPVVQGTRPVLVEGCNANMGSTALRFITFGSASRGSVMSTSYTFLNTPGVVMTNTSLEEAYDIEAVSGSESATFTASVEALRNNVTLSSSELLAGNIMAPESANSNMLPIGPSDLGSTNFSVSNFTGLTDVATALGGAGQAIQVTISGSGNAIWFTIPDKLRDFLEGKTVTWSLLGFGDVTASPTAGSTAVWEDVTPLFANTTATGTGITSNQAQLQQGTLTHTIGSSLTSLHFGFVMGGLAGSKPLVFETMSLQLGEIKPDGLSLV